MLKHCMASQWQFLCLKVSSSFLDHFLSFLTIKRDVVMVVVDLSKAFDMICHNLLLAKMKTYDVHDSAIKLVQSYLAAFNE